MRYFSYSPWIVENLKDDKQTIILEKKIITGGIIIFNNEKSFFKMLNSISQRHR